MTNSNENLHAQTFESRRFALEMLDAVFVSAAQKEGALELPILKHESMEPDLLPSPVPTIGGLIFANKYRAGKFTASQHFKEYPNPNEASEDTLEYLPTYVFLGANALTKETYGFRVNLRAGDRLIPHKQSVAMGLADYGTLINDLREAVPTAKDAKRAASRMVRVHDEQQKIDRAAIRAAETESIGRAARLALWVRRSLRGVVNEYHPDSPILDQDKPD